MDREELRKLFTELCEEDQTLGISLRERLCNERHKNIEVRFQEGERRMDTMSGKIDKLLFTGVTSLVVIVATLLAVLIK